MKFCNTENELTQIAISILMDISADDQQTTQGYEPLKTEIY